VVKKIAPNLNIWLLRCNAKQASGDELLAAIKSHKKVKEAQYNKKIELRQ
jgi:hypothetical protein